MRINKPYFTNSIVKTFHLWMPVVFWAIFIFTFSSVTTPMISPEHWQDFLIKKLAHVFEYSIFSLLLFRAFKGSGMTSKTALIYSLVTCIFYGITDEVHQTFTPGREPTMRDALIDSLSALVALLAIRDLFWRAPKNIRLIMFKLGVLY